MKMLQSIAVLLITCAFALTWGIVLREQIQARRPLPAAQAYDRLLPPDEDSREVRMGIYMGQLRLGESSTEIARLENGWIQVTSETDIALGAVAPMLTRGEGQITVELVADISPMDGLRVFTASSDELGMRLFGNVDEGILTLRGTVHDEFIETEMPYPEGMVLGDALSPLSGLTKPSPDRVGETWSMPFFNPLTGSVEQMSVRLSQSTQVQVGSERRIFYKLTFFGRGMRWNAWLDEQGEVVIQGTPLPLGITLQRQGLPPGLLEALMALDRRAQQGQ